jgi:hypothetical protein
MCSLELYNWYENRFPNDFKQLIQLKHYNISDLSFMLSSVWYKLNIGEKLLMCAVYYDDYNLAKQILNEKLMFRVNPFFGKNYTISRTATTTLNAYNQDEVFSDQQQRQQYLTRASPPRPRLNRHFSHQLTKKNEEELGYLFESSDSFYIDSSSVFLDEDSPSGVGNQEANLSMGQNTVYYFNQAVPEFNTHTPFHFAVKLDKYKMCELFVQQMKIAYSHLFFNTATSKQCGRQALAYLQTRKHSLSISHSSSLPYKAQSTSQKIYLNTMLSNSELIKLLVLALSNRSYDIAMLLLSNVYNPQEILNFNNLSESFIYNSSFCLQLLKGRIIDARMLLKESINRHSSCTTRVVLDYLYEKYAEVKPELLHDIYRLVIRESILIGDANIFRMIMSRLKSQDLIKLFGNELSIEGILLSNYYKKINKTRSTVAAAVIQTQTINNISPNGSILPTQSQAAHIEPLLHYLQLNIIDSHECQKLAATRNFDWELYFSIEAASSTRKSENMIVPSRGVNCYYISQLNYKNKLKMLRFIFGIEDNEMVSGKSLQELQNDLDVFWINFEINLNKRMSSNEKYFLSDETFVSIQEQQQNENSTSKCSKTMKRINLGRYLVYCESEPFLIETLIENLAEVDPDRVKLSNHELILAAKNSICELTIYYLLRNLNFDEPQNHDLLEPIDDVYGNFMEILLCRSIKCANVEQEQRLRRLFIETIVLKNAKMTCTTNLLYLFLTTNKYIRKRLLHFYFPCLFYLSNSFNLFINETHKKRFNMLFKWFLSNVLLVEEQHHSQACSLLAERSSILNNQQIDLLVYEHYATRFNNLAARHSLTSLKELARNSFMKVFSTETALQNSTGSYYTHSLDVVNLVNESLRQFLFCSHEIKHLLSN